MKRRVAIKILRSSLVNSRPSVQRFYREVKAVAHLEHSNIVRAYDAGEDAGIHYLVMEYVRGKTFSQVLKNRGPLPIDECLSCVIQAARGLAYAHRRGVIHRDIKPSNILYGDDGIIKILDMGLARLNDQLGGEIDQEAHDLTKTGQIMGTVDFMSPEQAFDSRSVDERSDIYSLGCTLYTLLADQPVYPGGTVMQKLLAHREAVPPSLCRVRMDVPPSLDLVFHKMVAKRSIDRYSTMTQVIADLQRIQVGEDVEVTPTSMTPTLLDRLSNARDKFASSPKLWLAVAVSAILMVGTVAAAVLLNGGDGGFGISQQPGNEIPEVTTLLKPDKTESVQRANGNGRKNDKKDDAKKDNDNKVQTNQGNDNKQPVEVAVTPTADQPGNNTKSETTDPKNGSSKQPAVEKKPIRTKAFLPLEPLDLVSPKGTTFTVLDDKSVLAEGGSLVDDVYSFQMKTDLPNLTAIRIDALPSDSMNAKGPGHGKDGGFAIIEVRVAAAPADNPNKTKVIELSGVKSDEAPKIIEKVIDGDDITYWPVRNGGKQTTLTLFMKNEVWYEHGTLLYVQIVQREKLGHFRVSVSNDPELVGKKTRIEANLPLFVNLGGKEKLDQAKRNWQVSLPFDGGAYGYVGGEPEGNDVMVPLTSCVSGIKEFRATVPDGKYNVLLYFSGRCPRDADKRLFHVSAHGMKKKQTIKNIPRRQTFVTTVLQGVEAKDGGLTIQFESEKGEPVLNGIAIEKAN